MIRDEVGQLVHEFAQEISDLAAGASVSFDDVWDTSGAQGESYSVVGQVVYGGKATEPVSVVVERPPDCPNLPGAGSPRNSMYP